MHTPLCLALHVNSQEQAFTSFKTLAFTSVESYDQPPDWLQASGLSECQMSVEKKIDLQYLYYVLNVTLPTPNPTPPPIGRVANPRLTSSPFK